ncbi:hypothetical protein VB715_17190 [Crocosphaera sp. UHCC 0190]|uniref:hypothetical protein n=1 Tax=Crocosphaera sp. UHCC 0190 TaxID=3110246 RepID=UPI002B21F014|nr:hypothetical protein [Crocosphaera sp. UHCC 0190]MEA5511510.1 hypothetical protein [Crocosphaera sp. UHCC 0190]
MIAFTGSANESINGDNFNYESIDVYRDWIIPDQERVVNKIEEFEDAWTGKADGLKTVDLSEKSLNFISSYAPNFNPFDDDTFKPQKIIKVSESSNKNNRWQHQEEAVKRFLEVRRGVLEAASNSTDFVEYFVSDYQSQQNLIIGLLIQAELSDKGLSLDDKSQTKKILKDLIDPSSITNLTDYGIDRINAMQVGGLTIYKQKHLNLIMLRNF